MKLAQFSLYAFLSLEACLCLVVLLKVLPAALKAGSLLGVAASLAAAMPWSLVAATGLALWRFRIKPRK